jgi:hypothetical protein
MGINDRQFLLNQIIWIGISLEISIIISPEITISGIISCYSRNIHFAQFLYEKRMGSGQPLFLRTEAMSDM